LAQSTKEKTMRSSLAVTAVLSLALLVVPGAFADRSYTDPAGDSGAAPDITAVAVSHDAASVVSFAVRTNQLVLAPDASFWGFIDTDRDATTGLPMRGLGADLFFLADADGGVIFTVNGNLITVDFDSSFSSSYGNGTFTARMNRSELGSTDSFAFFVEADQDDANGDTIGSDYAPDAPPFYEYSFVPVVLTVAPATGAPELPAAGKRFVVTVKVTRSDAAPFAAGAVACSARAGKVAVRPVASIAAGSARCSMKVPKGTTGKVLRGSMTVSAADSAPVTRPFAFRIR
jgi:hypothetical protein